MMENQFNFNTVIPRAGSDSIKWKKYPPDVLPLWVADMDFPTMPAIVEAMQERLSHPFFGYGRGDDALYGIIVDWLRERHGWQIEEEWLLTVPGVVAGMNWAIQSLSARGDPVAYQTPVYPPFLSFAPNANVEALEIPLVNADDGYEIDFDHFEQEIKSASVFALCNPHNPVGRVFRREELEKISDICLRNDIVICSDEIHCDLVFSGQRHIPIAALSGEVARKTITLMAPSKTFNIPGLEFSFAIVPDEDLRKRLKTGRRGVVGYPGLMAWPAAKAAYQHGARWLDELLVYLEGNRDFLTAFTREKTPAIKCHSPQGTYLAWLDCRSLPLKKNPQEFFLQNARVALNNGRDFGKEGEGFVRLNFATPRSILSSALEKMQAALVSLEE